MIYFMIVLDILCYDRGFNGRIALLPRMGSLGGYLVENYYKVFISNIYSKYGDHTICLHVIIMRHQQVF